MKTAERLRPGPQKAVSQIAFLREIATRTQVVQVGPSLETLAEVSGYAPRTTKAYIRELRDRGLVAQNDAHKHGYVLTPAGLAALSAPKGSDG